MENGIERGEIYFVHLDPSFGREIGGYKMRPVVVVSINDIHRNTRIAAVVPGTTTKADKPFQNVVEVAPDDANKLREPTWFLCHQVRSVDQGRMTARPIGRLSREDLRRIQKGLRHSLGLDLPEDLP